jgi:5-methylcytosine-specific restriction endonuclease McrA
MSLSRATNASHPTDLSRATNASHPTDLSRATNASHPTDLSRAIELVHLSNGELLFGVRRLVGEEREITAKLVAYLGEVEERRLHLEAGFPSMFAFCTKELGMSENEAFRRINAARLARRFPVIHALLASGAVHLSALELLREQLTEENHPELLDAASGKSKTEILEMLAARFPKPDVQTTIRKLPERSANGAIGGSWTGGTEMSFALEPLPTRCFEVAKGRVEPLSRDRYRVEFTASAELREKLELCRDLLSHANPTRELGVVVERAVDVLLRELEKKRLGRSTRTQSRAPPRGLKRGRIATATRRQVFERDGLQCTYVSPEGRRCDARAFLELDHEMPRACGGADEPTNVRILCRAHNQFAAEQVFGREHVERCRHFVRQKCPPAPTATNTMQRVHLALRTMGFRDSDARMAVARIESQHEDVEGLPVEQALREALLAATARFLDGRQGCGTTST